MSYRHERSPQQKQDFTPIAARSLHGYFKADRTNLLYDQRKQVLDQLNKLTEYSIPSDLIVFIQEQFEKLDRITIAHSIDVANLMWHFAADSDEAERIHFYVASLLHDIGKQDVSMRELILSPNPLTEEERKRIQKHPEIGALIIQEHLQTSLTTELYGVIYDAALLHHIDNNGNGYPELEQDQKELPKIARYLRIIDSMSAATMSRLYNEPESLTLVKSNFLLKFEDTSSTEGPIFDPTLKDKFLYFIDNIMQENP